MNRICGRAKTSAAARGPSPRDFDGAIAYLTELSEDWRQLQAAAREVRKPQSIRDQVSELLAFWDDAGDNFSQMSFDVAKNDEPSFTPHRALGQAAAQQGSRIAVSLGASECENLS